MSYAAFQAERVLKKYHFHCIKSDQAGLNGNRIRTDQCAIVIHSGGLILVSHGKNLSCTVFEGEFDFRNIHFSCLKTG